MEANCALREIAGRLKKLSYMDMLSFAGILETHWQDDDGVGSSSMARALLLAADDLEKA